MKKSCLTLLVLTFLLAAVGVPAPAAEQACVIVLEGQNQNRTVAGAVNVECGHPDETHTAPFGNWAVSSNYSHLLEDGNQFRGWRARGRSIDRAALEFLHHKRRAISGAQLRPLQCLRS